MEFVGHWGNKTKQVKVSAPNGGGDYQILIDKFYQGTIAKIHGEWVGNLNMNSDLTAEDILILGEMLDRISN